jgi:hypothetical protein
MSSLFLEVRELLEEHSAELNGRAAKLSLENRVPEQVELCSVPDKALVSS